MAESSVLLVEGKDDKHVLYHLLAHHQVPKRFYIKNKEGVDRLLDTLPVELLASDLQRLGLVIDANTDLAVRWNRVRGVLQSSGYQNVPAVPDPEGTIIQKSNQPVVGVWLMPDNTLPGMLENFMRFLVPGGDSLWEQAGRCLVQIPQQERRFPPDHEIKAHVHTWLAWQEEPGTPLGLAITKRYLDADAPHAQQLMQWLRRLFAL